MQVLVMCGILSVCTVVLFCLWKLSLWLFKTVLSTEQLTNAQTLEKDDGNVPLIITLLGLIIVLLTALSWSVAGYFVERDSIKDGQYYYSWDTVRYKGDYIEMSKEFYGKWLHRTQELEKQVDYYQIREKLLWGEDKP
jgi:hypothetical protein